MGKPLGLGVIKSGIDKSKSFVMDFEDLCSYYRELGRQAREVGRRSEVEWAGWKENAVKKFSIKPGYRDIKAIAGLNQAVFKDVKYPQSRRNDEFPGFQWFSKNKKQPLLTIEQISGGGRQTGWKGETE
jgi:hypothetical protein